MKNKSKSGISLIVLVITIIVMIILAGAIIVTLSNTGIMNKAQQAVDVTDMKQIETLASTLWADAYADGARTKEDLEKAVKDGLAANKITEKHYEGYELHVTTTGVAFKEPLGLNHSGTIPEDGVYYVGVTALRPGDYTGATATYKAGDSFPETVTKGDTYVFGDYEYRYDQQCTMIMGNYWSSTTINGWGVSVIDTKKTEYGEILESINDKDVKALAYTFSGCNSMISAPKIPSTITTVSRTFDDCSSMKTYVGSTAEDGDFSGYVVPDTVTDWFGMFAWCDSIVTAPDIPDTVTSMTYTFEGCESLKNVGKLPSSLTSLAMTFSYCTALEEAPEIPEGVTGIPEAFKNCTALKTVGRIPSTVTHMRQAFSGCTALTGTITIDANPTDYTECFWLTSAGKDITLAGSCSAETKKNLAGTSNMSYRNIYY